MTPASLFAAPLTLLKFRNSVSSSVNGLGVAPDGDWSGDKSTTQLKRQLTETQALLDEEKLKTKSLTDRLSVVRTELNQTKTVQMSGQRMLEDLQVSLF